MGEAAAHLLLKPVQQAPIQSPVVSHSLATSESGLRTPSRSLDAGTLNFFQPRFGRDLRHIQIHNTPAAEHSAEAMQAEAYTVRNHIVFNTGRYDPQSDQGRRLLSHEITHVLQDDSTPQRAPKKGKGQKPRKGRIFRVYVTAPMSAGEFLREFVKQYFQLTTDKAINQQLPLWNFVGKPRDVTEKDAERGYIDLPVFDAAIAEFATKSAQEQKAINTETDQRFWNETKYKPNQQLSTSPEDQKMGRQWLAVRAEVQLEHDELEQIQNLPPEIKAILFAGEKGAPQITPEDYPKLLAVAARFQQLTPAELSEYRSTINAQSTDIDELNRSLDRFNIQQKYEQNVSMATDAAAAPLLGAEDLYALYKAYKAADRRTAGHTTYGIFVPPSRADFKKADDAEAALLAALKPRGFDTIAAFEAAMEKFRIQFRTEAINIALSVLRHYEHMLFTEKLKFQKPENVAQLSTDIGASGAEADYTASNEKSSSAIMLAMSTGRAAYVSPKRSQQIFDLQTQATQLHESGEAKVIKASGQDALVADRGTDREKLAGLGAGDTQSFLLGTIDDRLKDISSTRAEFESDPDHVFELESLIEATRQSLNLDKKGIYYAIVQDRVEKQKSERLLSAIALAILALALAFLVPGGGWIAAAAMIANAGISTYQAIEAYNDYKLQSAEYDIGFLQTEPSLIWVGIAIGAAALDLGAPLSQVIKSSAKGLAELKGPLEEFSNATKVAGKGAEAAGEAGDAATALERLTAKIEEVKDLDRAVKDALESHAAAEKGFKKAVGELGGRLLAGGLAVDPVPALKAIYYAIKRGITSITKLRADAKMIEVMGDITKMSTADRQALTTAFDQVKDLVNAGKHMDEETMLKYVERLAAERSAGEDAVEALIQEAREWKPPNPAQIAATRKLDEAHSVLEALLDEKAELEAELRAGPKKPDGTPDLARVREIRAELKKEGLEDIVAKGPHGAVTKEPPKITRARELVTDAEKAADAAMVDPKEIMRRAFANSAERADALKNLDVIPVTRLRSELKTAQGTLRTESIDHIVSIKRMTQMDGFDKLRLSERKYLATMRENLVAMDGAANSSKGERSWAAWKQYSTFYEDGARDAMIPIENELYAKIQQWITTTTKGR